jgi:hypothetical protein
MMHGSLSPKKKNREIKFSHSPGVFVTYRGMLTTLCIARRADQRKRIKEGKLDCMPVCLLIKDEEIVKDPGRKMESGL